MSLSVYEASVPVFVSMLTAQSHVLNKGEAYAKEKGLNEAEVMTACHAPDMLPLKSQVYISTDLAKNCVSRLAQKQPPKYEDTEETFDELQARIRKTLDYLGTFGPGDFDGAEDREVSLKIAGNDMTFPGRAYLLGFIHPNFYFHVTTTYTILRSLGVPLGKADYFGQG